MLTTILPGLRDLRTPLATGYLYLTLLWIWFGSFIPPHDQASGLLLRTYELSGGFGASILLAVLSFVAYLVGSLLTIQRMPFLVRILRSYYFGTNSMSRGDNWGEMSTAQSTQFVEDLRQAGVPFEQAARILFPGMRMQKSELGEIRDSRGVGFAPLLAQRIGVEVPLVAVRLHAKNKDLYDDYDRSRSEAEFRASVAIPTTLITASLLFKLDGAWWLNILGILLAVLVGLTLVARSLMKTDEADSTVIQAIMSGIVKSPTSDLVSALIKRHKEATARSSDGFVNVTERGDQPS